MNEKLLARYTNGNYSVLIFSDGTKIRKTEEDSFKPVFPESIDFKITSYCDNNCPQCHEDSSINGKHASLNLQFLKTLKKGTELAIGGGNPLSHPDLVPFLIRMKEQGVICNITINQNHLFKNEHVLQHLINEKLIYGIGISYMETNEDLLNFCNKNSNSIIHLIIGIHSKEVLDKLANKDLKILLLGYKIFGRGKTYYNKEIDEKIKEINECFDEYKNKFSVISLDNLGYEQLQIDKRITKKEKDRYYMGDDGSFTMYIDGVDETYSINSTTPKEKRMPLKNNIEEMFQGVIKSI